MRFVKVLQKARNGNIPEIDLDENPESPTVIEDVPADKLPEFLSADGLNIGGPNSVIRGADAFSVDMPVTGSNAVEHLFNGEMSRKRLGELSVPDIAVEESAVNPHVVAITQPQSIYCEEYRNLRTQILQKSKLQDLQSIVIASIGASEGKSITALNLSWLLSQTDGVSALLIDCDLRKPSLTGYLGINAKKGLSDLLDGTAELKDAIVRLQPSGLYLLPGGKARSDVAELISGPTFAEILSEARAMFDYVIIDASPLGIFTDASVLINHADGALLVVKSNHTRYKDVARVFENLSQERLLGVVLNQAEETLIDSSYYDYPYYMKTQ